ncbi:FecCD family ABC transporter permease [Maritalea mediterranea]|uniref:Iron ABC transporter permease n=1 Tax=Maritalea mediterranea TaxID=2909667 RepID=A0ABS9E8R2_9HYPH|nr:iron ABC transporter permease [Maritalea mediterranea]MCF4098145.1 iron ABC transporter permease [Maritalea mediterranea]
MILRRVGEMGRFSVMAAVIALFFALHISIGAKAIPVVDVFTALIARDETVFDHIVVWDLRMPRALIAMVVGAALAVSGALMQGITRNPLADPGLLGLLAGASFAVVVGYGLWGSAIVPIMPLVAAGGALAAAALVFWIATAAPGGARPLTLILAGAAISAFLSAVIAAVQLLDQENFEQLRVWLTGTISGNRMDYMGWCLPWLGLGFLAALAVARQITSLAMGDEVAIGLGVNVAQVKVLSLVAVVSLTASAVTLSGPLGFIGLVIPHAVRLFVGTDYRFVVPYSALVGAAYLLFVDIVARVALAPIEISTGLVTSLLGAPFFVWLVRAKL